MRNPGSIEIQPTTITRHGGVVTYWRRDGMAYALIANAASVEVSAVARELATSMPSLRS